MVDDGDGRASGECDVPAPAQEINLLVGIDPAAKLKREMKVQQGAGGTETHRRAFLFERFVPSVVWGQSGSAADGGVLMRDLAVENFLGGRIGAHLFKGQQCEQSFLESAEAAFDFAFGLGAGSHEVGDAQGGEGAVETPNTDRGRRRWKHGQKG